MNIGGARSRHAFNTAFLNSQSSTLDNLESQSHSTHPTHLSSSTLTSTSAGIAHTRHHVTACHDFTEAAELAKLQREYRQAEGLRKSWSSETTMELRKQVSNA